MRTRIFSFFAIPLAWVTLSSSTAIAQDAGDRSDEEWSAESDDEARKIMAEYAQCIVKKKPSESTRLVSLDVLSPELQSATSDIRVKGCVPAVSGKMRLTFLPVSMRFLLAEALVRKDLKNDQVASFEQVPSLPRTPVPNPQHKARFENWIIDALGECLVRVSPEGSRAMLFTKVGSEGEDVALDGTRAGLAACISSDVDLTLNDFDLRGTVAVAYYRLATSSKSDGKEAAE